MSLLTAPSKAAATAQLMTENWLRNVFSSDLYTVRGRGPLAEDDAEHNPAVVVTHAHAHEGEPPVLVVEVSDVPVSDETVEKAGQFAAAGVRDYWVIEVAARRIHVYRDPKPDADARHGAKYGQVRIYSTYSLIAPLAAEIHLAQVINLLPW
jgi:Uma2 family endonuclease